MTIDNADDKPTSTTSNAWSPAAAISGGKNFSKRHWRLILIFLLALASRLIYSTVILEHRICHFGDAFYYLNTGSKLLALLTSGNSIPAMLQELVTQFNRHTNMTQSMLSLSLPDRLLMDGPVYPSYLAFIQLLFKINPLAGGDLGNHCQQFCFANCLLDTMTCLLIYYIGRLAFTRKQAFVAALIYALYPPAIINTQHCYSEPFASFLLAIWIALVLTCCRTDSKILSFALLGFFSGLIILAKPLFFFLPPLVAVVFLAASQLKISIGKKSLGALIAGLCLVIVPWLLLTRAITGNFMLLISRTPSYNLWAGNQLKTDGWRVWPAENIPFFVNDAVQRVVHDATSHPLHFVALELKKIPRLWAGVWNEDRFSLLGLNLDSQTFIHQLLLFLGFTGILLLLAGAERRTRAFQAGLLFASVIALHFMYVAFEPISRYNETAMPCVILAAAYTLCFAWQNYRKQIFRYLLTAAIFLLLIEHKNIFIACVAGVLPTQCISLVPIFDAFFFAALWLLLAQSTFNFVLAYATVRRYRLVQCGLILSFGIAIASSIAYSLTDESWHEWAGEVSQHQIIKQEIYIPASSNDETAAPMSYVLIDLQSPVLLPRLSISVNDQPLSYPPLLWAQANPVSADAVQLLQIQGQAMGRDLRSFRQWWAYPVPTSYLHYGGTNSIRIASDTPESMSAVKVFGDYTKAPGDTSDGQVMLPSLNTLSWTKGFATFDHKDPRVYNEVNLEGKTISSSWFDGINWNTEDLSPRWGKQDGRFRVFIAVANSKLPVSPTQNEAARHSLTEPLRAYPLIGAETVHGILGADPTSMVITPRAIPLPNNLPAGTLFLFQSEMQSIDKSGNAFISIDFHGQDNGQAVAWSSSWQPACIKTTSDWQAVCIADFIPERILRLQNLQVSVLVSPFYPDLLYLKRKQALKAETAIRNAGIELMPPIELPKQENLHWRIY